MQREVVGDVRVPAPDLDERAESVSRRVRVTVDDAAVDLREPRGAGEGDVLAELGSELGAFLFEFLLPSDALLPHRLEDLLREGEELVVVRDGLRFAADADDDAQTVLDAITDLPLGSPAACALRRRGEPLLA